MSQESRQRAPVSRHHLEDFALRVVKHAARIGACTHTPAVRPNGSQEWGAQTFFPLVFQRARGQRNQIHLALGVLAHVRLKPSSGQQNGLRKQRAQTSMMKSACCFSHDFSSPVCSQSHAAHTSEQTRRATNEPRHAPQAWRGSLARQTRT